MATVEKKKAVVKRFMERQSDDERSDVDLIYTIEGDSEVIQSVGANWNWPPNTLEKLKHIRLAFTNPSAGVVEDHKEKITPILASNNKAILLSKSKDETIQFWCKFRLQGLAKFDVEFDDRIDEDPIMKKDMEISLAKEGNFKTDESSRW